MIIIDKFIDTILKGMRRIKIDRKKAIMKFQNKDIQDVYVILEKVGEGGYGKVYRAVHRETGTNRAIKRIKKKNLD